MTQKVKADLSDIRTVAILDTPRLPEFYTSQEVQDLAAKAGIQEKLSEITARESYASKIFWTLIAWLIGVYALIILVGLETLTISDSVLIALVTSTTINVIGLFGFVMRYLFHRRK